MAYACANLFHHSGVASRILTVCGPWGRADMALFLPILKIRIDEPIDLFNNASHSRDFIDIDDIV